MKNFSLKLRLSIILLFLFAISSIIAISISMYQTKKTLVEVLDTQLYYFAKRVVNSNINTLINSSNLNYELNNINEDIAEKYMSIEDDSLTYAIYSLDGKIIYKDFSEENNDNFVFNNNILNTNDGLLFEENKEFKIVWMRSNDKKFIVMVAQEIDYLNDLIFDIIENLTYPWLFVLPFLVAITFILISKELKPLNKLSNTLASRNPNDSSTLDENTTIELKPVVKALNLLFIKIINMIEKERRFTSNAAHELKTPLAAIKIQTEVAKLSLDDKDSLIKSLNNIEMGVDKSTRMIEQLLALSRLESISNFENLTNINWIEIINSTIKEVEFNAKQKDISIDFLYDEDIKTIKGEPFILSLLIRNLLDNAIKYNEKGTKIEIKLEKNNLFIQDNGKGLDSKILKNIGERFLRPAGQKQIGSGLGFSIIMQIAKLHNLNVNFENINPNGFKINIYW